MRIFIIDDNGLHLKMCNFILTKLEHEVYIFDSVKKLDDFTLQNAIIPDILFIDYRLGPSETGLDVLERVKNKYKWKSAKCIAFTADVSEASQLRASGFDSVILKPVTENMLKEVAGKYSR
ncbi:response regulator [Geovibrio thiophilus]|uniref:Response regulator n=1 Tax=Geovibrio thiophilus TaxID=139438 RepID=A0A3R5UZU3_9BACT|nr:response regulator [Geovibrio thiophilus]QAR33757.1 response regulator [Geovibrio thiophilus]